MDKKDIAKPPIRFRLPRFLRILLYHKKLVLIIFIALAISICAFCVSYKILTDDVSKITFFNEPLTALNRAALKGVVKEGNYAYFAFRETQQKLFSDFYNTHSTTSVIIKIGVPKLSAESLSTILLTPFPFYYGFLYPSDFNNGKFVTKKSIENRSLPKILAGCDLRNFFELLNTKNNSNKFTYFQISFAIAKNTDTNKLPIGFFITTTSDLKITDVAIDIARLGFDKTSDVAFFGVSSNGGDFGSSTLADFTGAPLIFSSSNNAGSLMPCVTLTFQNNGMGLSDGGDWKRSFPFLIAGNTYAIYKAQDDNLNDVSIKVQTQLLKQPFSRYETKSKTVIMKKIIMAENDEKLLTSPGISPLKTDVGLITTGNMTNWRNKDYELFEWDRFKNVLIFDTRNYKVQSDFFRRMAFYCEKKGYRGKVLTDRELGDMHGYNAHDYSSKSIANFFNAVDKRGVKITDKEIILRDIALNNGLIEKSDTGYKEGLGAVISISQQSPLWLRRSLSNHELWHGLYFTDEDFRKKCSDIYESLGDKSHDFITGYWASQETLGYDQSDEDLLRNELMAYIMQQSKSNVAPYFVHLANRGSVMAAIPKLCEWVRDSNGAVFIDISKKFDDYVRARWHLNCGRAGMVYQ